MPKQLWRWVTSPAISGRLGLVIPSSARRTASAGSAATTVAATGRPFASRISQPPRETTGIPPRRRASATSDSVPHEPPMTITASADSTRIALRASPMFVNSTADNAGHTAARSVSGRTPITSPPASAVPAATAAITPVPPPHSTVTPARAKSAPTARAHSASCCVHSLGPQTATCRTGLTPRAGRPVPGARATLSRRGAPAPSRRCRNRCRRRTIPPTNGSSPPTCPSPRRCIR